MNHQIKVPAFIRMGGGTLAEVAEAVTQLGAMRPLIVTDGFIVSTGLAKRVSDLLIAGGLAPRVFSETVPDPTTASLAAGVAAIHEHEADMLIGLGGGSPIDTSKALAVLAIRGGTMRELKAPVSYAGPALSILAIPTTAGTGSEATQFTVISDSETGEKMLCAGHSYLPKSAIVDFELTLSMPPRLTADTGIDALTHAIEAYVSKKANGFSDALAMSAIATIGKNLRTAYADGNNRDAREAMMEAASFAGIAFSNASVALVHAMSRPLGAHFHVAHGMANAMLFAAVTEYSLGVLDDRYAECGRALGVATASDSDEVAARALVAVPSPEKFGISSSDWEGKIALMAEQAIGSGSHLNNPRVPSAADIEAIYRRIYSN